ncbi:MoaD/ThiS family protein [Actinomadura oligospora]|uniref:MoaD/ThiS family protein n=1 Tax=Actinomadura oligospora TaxID=111804 RepID=UPI00047DEB6E|nr:MoaD/ThiS family protein [Actinomadura oligospora]
MNVTVRIPGALRDLVGAPAAVPLDLPADATVGDALAALDAALPAVGRRVRDETGALRPHVNVFVGADNIRDLAMLATRLEDDAVLNVLPALSGG